MLHFELMTWIAVGAAIGVLFVAFERKKLPWPLATMVTGAAGALAGGAALRATGTTILMIDGYSVAALMMATLVGFAAVKIVGSLLRLPPVAPPRSV
jgi:hypothetical protein